jgi:hypothetical protein
VDQRSYALVIGDGINECVEGPMTESQAVIRRSQLWDSESLFIQLLEMASWEEVGQ